MPINPRTIDATIRNCQTETTLNDGAQGKGGGTLLLIVRRRQAGVDRFTRDLIQQHAKGDTGSIHYDRHDYGPQMRAGMDRWNDWLEQVLVAPEQPGGALPQLGAVDAQAQV